MDQSMEMNVESEDRDRNSEAGVEFNVNEDGLATSRAQLCGPGSAEGAVVETEISDGPRSSTPGPHVVSAQRRKSGRSARARQGVGNFVGSAGRKLRDAELPKKISFFPCFSCCTRRKSTMQFRTVIPNHMFDADHPSSQHPNRRYKGNRIRTTKYSIFSFVPKNLFEQFHRFANLYFIFIVILNWIPAIEVFGREVSAIPVLFVMSITALKDAFEDFRRYKSDRKINSFTCRVWNNSEGRYVKTLWKDLIVGDFVHLSCNETIPADILLLKSADLLGICYVETSNLDGESNLKQRQVVSSLQNIHDSMREAGNKTGKLCPQETAAKTALSFMQGKCSKVFRLHQMGGREAINKNNLLLRGCEIRNTDYVEGIVVYAGHETKAMKNNNGPRYKRSELERLMNWDVVWCVVILLVLCVIGAIGSGIWLSSFQDPYTVPFLTFVIGHKELKPEMEGFINFWSYIVILQVMIPISLYVSIELIKLGQIFFIMQDANLYHERSDKRIQCRALNIPEELGQIEYVMSDKTGTLTENQMIFRRCAIAGVDYGPSEVNSQKEQKGFPGGGDDHAECVKEVKTNPRLVEEVGSISSEIFQESLSDRAMDQKAAFDFFINMAVCNTAVVTAHPHVDKMNASGYFVAGDFMAGPSGGGGVDGDRLSLASGISSRAVTPAPDDPRNFAPRPNNLDPADVPPHLKSAQSTPGLSDRKAGKLPPLEGDGPTPLDNPSPKFFVGHRSSADGGVVVEPLRLGDTSDFSGTEATFMTTSRSIPEIRMEVSAIDSEPMPVLEEEKSGTVSADATPRTARKALKNLLKLPSSLASKMRTSKDGGNGEVTYRSSASTPAPLNPIYEAESPDELSLVYTANAYGFRLLKRQVNYVLVEMPDGSRAKYDLLHILPFDAVRKRMSVIVKSPHSNKPILYCKGADAAIMELLSEEFSQTNRGQHYIFKSQEYLNLYASYGLRTLCLSKRELDEGEYREWLELHVEAEMALEDREELLFQSALRIEKSLELLGVTGIEDRLQDGVPEAIAALRHAGMKVWVLTGDKIETAVNIAYASRLFSYGMELIQICAKTEADTKEMIAHHLEMMREGQESEEADEIPRRRQRIGLVVDGRTLSFCLHPHPDEKFVELVSRCTSVLCCRATPLQKSNMVRMVKEKLEAKTLAIGDGANDVSMIQSADVGIGINGQEGMQAVMASDFALPRFNFLRRLLLVHGHWCYDRLARTVLYFFYKNALFVFTLFWFQIFCGFSSQNTIDPIYLTLYNLVFTSLPPLLFGVFDQSAPDHLLMDQPKLYSVGRLGLLYKSYSFWMVIGDAVWQSLVIFFVSFWVYQDSDTSLWMFGFMIFSSIVMCNQVHLATEVKSWTVPLLASMIVSVVMFVAFSLVYNATTDAGSQVKNPPYWVAETMMSGAVYWLTLIFTVFLAMLPRVTVKIVSNSLQPPDVLLARLRLREKQRKGKLDTPAGNFVAWWSRSRKKVSIVKPGGSEAKGGIGTLSNNVKVRAMSNDDSDRKSVHSQNETALC